MRKILSAFTLLSSFWWQPAWAEPVVSSEVELLELHIGEGDEHFVFDATAEAGPVVLKVEGGSDVGPNIDEVTGQLLYAIPVTDSTKTLIGVRHDFRGGSDLSHAVIAFEHEFAPFLEGESYFMVSEHGDLTGSAQVVASLDLPAGAIFEPRVALGWSAQDILRDEIGSGFSESDS